MPTVPKLFLRVIVAAAGGPPVIYKRTHYGGGTLVIFASPATLCTPPGRRPSVLLLGSPAASPLLRRWPWPMGRSRHHRCHLEPGSPIRLFCPVCTAIYRTRLQISSILANSLRSARQVATVGRPCRMHSSRFFM